MRNNYILATVREGQYLTSNEWRARERVRVYLDSDGRIRTNGIMSGYCEFDPNPAQVYENGDLAGYALLKCDKCTAGDGHSLPRGTLKDKNGFPQRDGAGKVIGVKNVWGNRLLILEYDLKRLVARKSHGARGMSDTVNGDKTDEPN